MRMSTQASSYQIREHQRQTAKHTAAFKDEMCIGRTESLVQTIYVALDMKPTSTILKVKWAINYGLFLTEPRLPDH